MRLVAAVVDAAEQVRQTSDVGQLAAHHRHLLRILRVARSRHSAVDPWRGRYAALTSQLERAWQELRGAVGAGLPADATAAALAAWCRWLAGRVADLVEQEPDPAPPLGAYARALHALVPREHEVGSGVSSSVAAGIRAHVRLVEHAVDCTVVLDERPALVR